jgi:hypothetical protein
LLIVILTQRLCLQLGGEGNRAHHPPKPPFENRFS